MPVATFAEFMAEQAVAIAIGAAAVVVAPKAGPKLAELGSDLSAKVKSMTDSTPSAAAVEADAVAEQATTNYGDGPAGAAAAAASVATVGRSLAEKLAGSAQKLGQEWSALLAEVAAESPAPEAAGPDVRNVLAAMSAGNVVSFAPGRARLRLHALRGQPDLVGPLGDALAAVEGVREAQANAATGSVLLLFDARRYPTPEALLEAITQP